MSWRQAKGVVWGGLGEHDFKLLATYNAERHRGLVHTEEWQERMAELQRRFDERMNQTKQDA